MHNQNFDANLPVLLEIYNFISTDYNWVLWSQGAAQSRPWLADLVLSSQESLDVLPVQCLCEFLLLQTSSELAGKEIDEKGEKQKVCKKVSQCSYWKYSLLLTD